MPSPTLLDALQGRPWPAALWRADQLADAGSAQTQPTLSSGFAALDAELPGGGWPLGGLCELLLDGPGQGEWRLLAPALGDLTCADRRHTVWTTRRDVVCIGRPLGPGAERANRSPASSPKGLNSPNSPKSPADWQAHGPGLAALGLDPARLLWVETDNLADGAWAAEQALRSGGCTAVLWWTGSERPGRSRVAASPHPSSGRAHRPAAGSDPMALNTHLRRLHLAALGRPALLWVLRASAAAGQSSPAVLRLSCRPLPTAPGRLQVQLLKRRGPPLAQPLELDALPALGAVLAHRLSQPLPTPRPVLRPVPAPPRIPQPPRLFQDVSQDAFQDLSQDGPELALTLAPVPAGAVAVPAPAAIAAGRPRTLA